MQQEIESTEISLDAYTMCSFVPKLGSARAVPLVLIGYRRGEDPYFMWLVPKEGDRTGRADGRSVLRKSAGNPRPYFKKKLAKYIEETGCVKRGIEMLIDCHQNHLAFTPLTEMRETPIRHPFRWNLSAPTERLLLSRGALRPNVNPAAVDDLHGDDVSSRRCTRATMVSVDVRRATCAGQRIVGGTVHAHGSPMVASGRCPAAVPLIGPVGVETDGDAGSPAIAPPTPGRRNPRNSVPLATGEPVANGTAPCNSCRSRIVAPSSCTANG